MSIESFLFSLEDSAIGAAIAGSETLFPSIETVHVLALSMVFGTIVMVDLRLLGLASRNSAVSKLTREVLPYTWAGFILAVLTGSLMFVSRATTYFPNLQFRLKFLCLALAGINMALFHAGAYRRIIEWDDAVPPPSAARLAGAISIALWFSVILFGRWMGFTI